MAIDMGVRQRCENCVHGMVDRNSRNVPVSAFCRFWKMPVPASRFKVLTNCITFQKKEGM